MKKQSNPTPKSVGAIKPPPHHHHHPKRKGMLLFFEDLLSKET
jgi:hypothetical protein